MLFCFILADIVNRYTFCPNGLACMPKMFSKLMKPIYATLRSEGYIILSLYMIHVLVFVGRQKRVSKMLTVQNL